MLSRYSNRVSTWRTKHLRFATTLPNWLHVSNSVLRNSYRLVTRAGLTLTIAHCSSYREDADRRVPGTSVCLTTRDNGVFYPPIFKLLRTTPLILLLASIISMSCNFSFRERLMNLLLSVPRRLVSESSIISNYYG